MQLLAEAVPGAPLTCRGAEPPALGGLPKTRVGWGLKSTVQALYDRDRNSEGLEQDP